MKNFDLPSTYVELSEDVTAKELPPMTPEPPEDI